MNLEKILEELRNEVESINEAIAALQRLVPSKSDDHPSKQPTPK
jgi:hypothetical protein